MLALRKVLLSLLIWLFPSLPFTRNSDLKHLPILIPYQVGIASWYGGGRDGFAGRCMASGRRMDPLARICAHRRLPLGTILRVVCPATGRSTRLEVSDRGPYKGPRILDVSYQAALDLGFMEAGLAEVHIFIESMPKHR